MKAIDFIKLVAKKSLTGNRGSGIRSIPSAIEAEAKAGEIAAILQSGGIPLQQLDDYIRSEADVLKFLNIIENANKPRVISGTSAEGKAITEKLFGKKGEVVDFPQKRSFKEEIDAMRKSGDIVDEKDMVISDKITDREMFKNSNLNKEPISEKFIDYTIQDINKKEPLEGMKIANKIIKREGEFKDLTEAQSKRILKETEDHIFERDVVLDEFDPEYAKGGRAGYAVGNQVTPQVDARMNLDYDTLVNQNQAQAATQAKARNEGILQKFGKHAITSNIMKGETGKNTIPEYALQTGADFQMNFPNLNPKISSGLAAAYQTLQEGSRAILDGPGGVTLKDAYNTAVDQTGKNIEGILAADTGTLTAEQLKNRNEYLPIDQQTTTPTPDAGTATQAGVIPGFTKISGDKFYGVPEGTNAGTGNEFMYKGPDGQIYGSETYSSIAAGQYPDIYDPNKQKSQQPGSLEEYLSGYEKYKSTNPNTYKGTQALIDATLPGGIDYTFTGGSHASHFNDYLESIGLSPYQKNLNSISEKVTALNKGGRAGFYTGGITDVEPSLDDIGHGADAMNARTRLMSPGNQATTSTGLNYLLAEDNDNMRIPFSAGGGGRRAFLKFLASIGGLTAAAKSGIIGLGEGTTKKAVTETVKKAAGSTYPPPYFFKLVEKIKFMGDDVTVGSSTMPRTKVTRYKDYELTEDLATGSQEIKKIGIEDDMITKNEYMTYTKGHADETTKGKKPADDYEEVTEVNSRIYKDNYNDPDYEDGIELKEILEEVGDPDSMTLKKADGGRIGFDGGGSPLQRLRQSLVDDLMYKFPSMKEEDMQMIVKDINLDMSTEEAQASMSANFSKVFGKSGMFSTGGVATMLGE
jgi:hypothetical protein